MNRIMRNIAVGLICLAVITVAGQIWSVSSQGRPQQPGQSPAAPPGAAISEEARTKVDDAGKPQHDREARGRSEIVLLSGPGTRGRGIRAGGRDIRMPQDAFVKDFVIAADCEQGKFCPGEYPALVVDRQGAKAWVGVQSGDVLGFENAEGRENLFEFLPGRRRGQQ